MRSIREPVLVSVVVPMYNAGKLVLTALTSILQECQVPLEVIVVNDGSTDDSLQKVKQLDDRRIQIIDNQGKGIAAALNTGFALARGEIITRCDADDLYPAARLVEQVDWLMMHPNFGAVCGGYSAIDAKGLTVLRFDCGTEAEEITQELRTGITRTHFCTFAVRAEIIDKIGGCRPYFLTAEDIDLQLRIGDCCRVWYQPGNYYYYRLHSSSITHTISSTERDFFETIARKLQEQRQVNGLDDLERGHPPLPPSIYDRPPLTAAKHIQKLLVCRAWQEYQQGDRLRALVTGVQSVVVAPQNLAAWRSLLALAVR